MNNQLTVQLKEVNEIVTRAYQLIQEAEIQFVQILKHGPQRITAAEKFTVSLEG